MLSVCKDRRADEPPNEIAGVIRKVPGNQPVDTCVDRTPISPNIKTQPTLLINLIHTLRIPLFNPLIDVFLHLIHCCQRDLENMKFQSDQSESRSENPRCNDFDLFKPHESSPDSDSDQNLDAYPDVSQMGCAL